MRLRIAAWIGFALLSASALAQNRSVDLAIKVTDLDFNPVLLNFTVIGSQQGKDTRLQGTQWSCSAGKSTMGEMEAGWGWTEDSLYKNEEVTIHAELDRSGKSLSVRKLEKKGTQLDLEKNNASAADIVCKLQSNPAKK